ncbi:hypothetical protein JCM10212_003900 [Sporobolomyces blumeae]
MRYPLFASRSSPPSPFVFLVFLSSSFFALSFIPLVSSHSTPSTLSSASSSSSCPSLPPPPSPSHDVNAPSSSARLARAEWELSKTHRMKVRAHEFGRREKEEVFRERESRWRDEVGRWSIEVERGVGQVREVTNTRLKGTATTTTTTTKATTTKTTTKATREATSRRTTTTKTPRRSKTSQPSSISTTSISAASTLSSKPSQNPSNDKKQNKEKKGLGYNHLSDLTPFASFVSWIYNWDSRLDEDESIQKYQTRGFDLSGNGRTEFVPMLWNDDQDHVRHWDEDVKGWIEQGRISHLLGFNEPDLSSQANMTVQQAVEAWDKYLEPYHDEGIKLVSPAVTNGGAPGGVTWLEGFMDGVEKKGYHVDAIALHWYDSPTNFAYFKNYLRDAHSKFGLPIWLTEFGFSSGSDADKAVFYEKMVAWMDDQDWIERYAAFGDFVGIFVDSTGTLLDLGAAYKAA